MSITAAALKDQVHRGFMVETVEDMNAEYLEALKQTLIISADTELMSVPVTGFGPRFAPTVNAQISCVAIHQDEMGHNHIAVRLLADLGVDTDWLLYERPWQQWKQPYLFAIRLINWSEIIVFHCFTDRTGYTLLADAYHNTSYGPWKRALAKVDKEELFHLRHGETWIRKLIKDPDWRREIQTAVDWMFPMSCEQFGLPDHMKTRTTQLEYKLKGKTNDQLRQDYITSAKKFADTVGIKLPVHWNPVENKWDFDHPFPAHFDFEQRVYDWNRPVTWHDVMARWKQGGPHQEEFIEELQRGARQFKRLREAV